MCIIFMRDNRETVKRTNTILRNSKKLFDTANTPYMLSL